MTEREWVQVLARLDTIWHRQFNREERAEGRQLFAEVPVDMAMAAITSLAKEGREFAPPLPVLYRRSVEVAEQKASEVPLLQAQDFAERAQEVLACWQDAVYDLGTDQDAMAAREIAELPLELAAVKRRIREEYAKEPKPAATLVPFVGVFRALVPGGLPDTLSESEHQHVVRMMRAHIEETYPEKAAEMLRRVEVVKKLARTPHLRWRPGFLTWSTMDLDLGVKALTPAEFNAKVLAYIEAAKQDSTSQLVGIQQ